ncbi:MAG: single-stranded DNA-binding protein [Victivallales bacterium]|nr:single-stranded DNA-binding protein [Victivallales bacterium]
MANLNRVCLLGTLTSEPEVRSNQDGAPVAVFGLSVTTQVPNLRGQDVDETSFVDVEAGGRLTEIVPQIFHKGSAIFVDGRLAQQTLFDRNTGRKRYRMYVNAEVIQKAEPDGMAVPEPPPGLENGSPMAQEESSAWGAGDNPVDSPF